MRKSSPEVAIVPGLDILLTSGDKAVPVFQVLGKRLTDPIDPIISQRWRFLDSFKLIANDHLRDEQANFDRQPGTTGCALRLHASALLV